MKASFYFVIWIIIYPLLGLLHNPTINQNSFIVALLVVWALSWFLNRSMPLTLRYEAAESRVSIMEELYSGNTEALRKRLSRQVAVQFVSAIYFGVTFIFVLFSIFRNSDFNDWLALVLFAIFAYGAINSAVTLNKAKYRIINDPSRQSCSEVLRSVYRLDFDSYEARRNGTSVSEMLPPPPPHLKAFRIFSLVVAVICALLGILQFLRGVGIMAFFYNGPGISGGIMYLLYGSLAAYFGIKDTIDIGTLLRPRKS